MRTITFFVLFLFILCFSAEAQVGIGTLTPNANSILELYSGTQGLLIPRILNASRPANTAGMLLYQTDGTPGIYMNNGSVYSRLLSGTGTTNYLTKFNAGGDLQSSLLFDNGTSIGLGTTTPDGRLEIEVDATSQSPPNTLRLTSNWNPTTVSGLYNAYAMYLQTTGTLANSQGGNTGNFISFYSNLTTTGSGAGNMQISSTRGSLIETSFASNGQSISQIGCDVRSTLDQSSGNIVSNTGLRVVTGNTLVSANPGLEHGTINNNYGVLISTPSHVGTIWNNYGLYIGNMNAVGSTLNYPIFYNAPSSDAYLTVGGVWTNACDSTGKANIIRVNTSEILDKICKLPISLWNYKCEKEQYKHISPMAQDFQNIFNVGYQDNTISTIDPPGVALAGIQELVKKNTELKQVVAKQQEAIEELQRTNSEILKRLHELENSSLR